MIEIFRRKSYVDKMRAYQVILDDKKVAQVKEGEAVEVDCPNGNHKLKIKLDWCESPTIKFSVDNEPARFECGSNLTGIKLFFILFYVIFRRKNYISLRQI